MSKILEFRPDMSWVKIETDDNKAFWHQTYQVSKFISNFNVGDIVEYKSKPDNNKKSVLVFIKKVDAGASQNDEPWNDNPIPKQEKPVYVDKSETIRSQTIAKCVAQALCAFKAGGVEAGNINALIDQLFEKFESKVK